MATTDTGNNTALAGSSNPSPTQQGLNTSSTTLPYQPPITTPGGQPNNGFTTQLSSTQPSGITTPTVGSSINPGALSSTPQTIPPTPQDNSLGSVNGATAGVNAVNQQNQAQQIAQGNNLGGQSQSVNQLNQNVQGAQVQYSQTDQQIQQLMTQLGYKAQDTQDLLYKSNINQYNSNISDLSAQYQQGLAQYHSILTQQGGTNSGFIGLQASIQASNLASISAQMQAVNGNINSAYDQIGKAIDLKYQPLTDQLTVKEKYLSDNYQNLTNAQQKLADRQSQVIASQKENIQNNQQTAVKAQGDLQTAITNGTVDAATGYQAISDFLNGKISIGDFYNKIGTTNPSGGGSGYGNQVVNNTIQMIGGGVTGNMTVSQAVAQAGLANVINGIVQQEGGTPQGTNNPGNIKFAGQAGATRGKAASDGGNFANFATPQDFQNAIGSMITKNANTPLSNFIASYKGVSLTPAGDTPDFLQGKPQSQVDAYNSLPPIQQSNVSQLVQGQALLSDLVTSKGIAGQNQRQQLLAAAQKVDPTFTENTNKIRYAYNKDWNDATTNVGKTKVSINTALNHLAEVKADSTQLSPTDLQQLNGLKNWWDASTGNTAILNLQTSLNALASEVATVYKGGTAPSDSEVEGWKKTLGTQLTQNQFAGVLDTTAKLLSGKISSLNYNYQSTMGANPPQPVIDPMSRQALTNAGINPASIAPDPIQTIAKGNMDDKSFVEKALTAQNLTYDNLVSQMRAKTPAGTQPALDNATGSPVFATADELKSGKYTPL